MQVNADFTKRVVMRFDDTPWVASPAKGVERKMLDRLGGEVARATTIVRFAPGSAFAAHAHDGGEEYIVLDGTFQDEAGDFTAGTYVRNPPTTQHTPAAALGAMIFVKLHQFHPDDRAEICTETQAPGLLFANEEERVEIVTLSPGEAFSPPAQGGLELLVLDGMVTEATDTLRKWDWLRLPVGTETALSAGPDGTRFWLKTGHLAARPPQPPA